MISRMRLKALLPLLALTLSSCSIGFHRDWKTAAKVSSPPQDLSGAWTGTWRSEGTGHEGKLKAIATPVPSTTGPQVYTFRYHATWAKLLSGGYTARHEVKHKGKDFLISGEQDLGKLLGGIYHYEGKATAEEFKASYKCDFDHGFFEMKRP
jgi:hypothetical protein